MTDTLNWFVVAWDIIKKSMFGLCPTELLKPLMSDGEGCPSFRMGSGPLGKGQELELITNEQACLRKGTST